MLSSIIEKVTDTDDLPSFDSGGVGKKFEDILLFAFGLIGLKFEKNSKGGKGWDFKPIGDQWLKIINNKNINVKIANTKWLFGSAVFGKIIDWDNFGDDDLERAKKEVKKAFSKNGINRILFLRPKTSDIQSDIISATKKNDVIKLKELLQKKNFSIKKLGNSYEVKISVTNKKVSSIVILKDGKVFMRSERPRKVGGSKNFVGFRKDSIPKTKKPRKLINKSEQLRDRIKLFLEV